MIIIKYDYFFITTFCLFFYYRPKLKRKPWRPKDPASRTKDTTKRLITWIQRMVRKQLYYLLIYVKKIMGTWTPISDTVDLFLSTEGPTFVDLQTIKLVFCKNVAPQNKKKTFFPSRLDGKVFHVWNPLQKIQLTL